MNEVYNCDKSQIKKYLSLTIGKRQIIYSIMFALMFVFTLLYSMYEFDEYRLQIFCFVAGFFLLAYAFSLLMFFISRNYLKKTYGELQLIFADDAILLEKKRSRTTIFYSEIRKIKIKNGICHVSESFLRKYQIPVCCFEDQSKIEMRLESIAENIGSYEKTQEFKRIEKITRITVIAGIALGIIAMIIEILMDD